MFRSEKNLYFRRGVILSAVLTALLLAGCGEEKSGPAAGPANAAEVGVVTIQPRRVVYTTELAGRTSPFQISDVRPQISGIIQKRLFEEGSDVKAGDMLYQIDPATYKANLDSARANLAKAEANVAPARLKRDRFRDLVNISAVSKQEYEDADAAYKQAQAEVGVNRAAVENARIRLDYTRVTSPISGRIGRSSVTPGALVTENQAAPLATVQQLDPMYVDVTQSSAEVLRLKRSLESGRLQRTDAAHAAVRLLLEDGSPYPEQGELQFTDVSVDQSTGAVTLRAIFPNPRQDLLPGMYVRAILAEGLDEQAILLPQRALVRDARGNPTAWVVTPKNTVEIRKINVSRTHGDAWVVTDGLKPGEKVIVEGLQKVRQGSPVHATDVAWEPSGGDEEPLASTATTTGASGRSSGSATATGAPSAPEAGKE